MIVVDQGVSQAFIFYGIRLVSVISYGDRSAQVPYLPTSIHIMALDRADRTQSREHGTKGTFQSCVPTSGAAAVDERGRAFSMAAIGTESPMKFAFYSKPFRLRGVSV